MEFKKDIENLLISLKKLGLDRRGVERRLNYADKYIDQALSKGGNLKLLNALTLLHQNVAKSNTGNDHSNILKEPEIKIENSSKKKKDNTFFDDDLHTLIQSNKNLTEAKLIDSEAGLLLAQTNASLTARVLQNIDNGIKNEPEILEALNANMRGLLAAIAKVATGARYESEDLAVEALGKIVHDKHRKEKQEDSSSVVSN